MYTMLACSEVVLKCLNTNVFTDLLLTLYFKAIMTHLPAPRLFLNVFTDVLLTLEFKAVITRLLVTIHS